MKATVTSEMLTIRQRMPLVDKIIKTKQVLAEFIYSVCEDEKAYLAFSGGKDSTVLLHILQTPLSKFFPEFAHPDLDLVFDIPAVFNDTGVELPPVRDFVAQMHEKYGCVETIRPKVPFARVIKTFGYPMISKEQSQYIRDYRHTNSDSFRETRLNGNKWGMGKVSKRWHMYLEEGAPEVSDRCCHKLKKEPAKRYEKSTGRLPILGTMAEESKLRRQKYLKEGCIGYDTKRKTCQPLSFWLEKDIWEFYKITGLEICSIYPLPGVNRTGCCACGFGCINDSRFYDKFSILVKYFPRWFKTAWEVWGVQPHYKLICGKDTPDWLGFNRKRKVTLCCGYI